MIGLDFSNKNVIITGGNGGIGTPVVRGILEGGGNVILTARRNIDDFTVPLKEEFGDDRVKSVTIDMADPVSIRSGYEKLIKDIDRVDVLINVAGIVSTASFSELSQEEWDRTIAINLTALYVGCQVMFNHMKETGGGRIVNVSSVAGKIGGGLLGTSAYAASKAGVNALTKAIAKEGGKYNINCNAVCPSLTYTKMTASMDDEKTERIINSIPLHRGAQPQEIANVILFYASDLASFCTGEISDADGGIVLDG